ncbi:MAG: hypothetical protein KJ548_00960 [Actinobacteria bacterium]|nr:hypothetical protein [Actinomycetota bacterium]
MEPLSVGRRSRLTTMTATVARVALVLLLAACAAGANPDVGSAPPGQEAPAGFWLGLWHGIILPISVVVSFFTDTVSPYEVYNNGNWYDFGFVFGISLVFGGPLSARRAHRH